MAGLCPLTVRVQIPDAEQPPVLLEQEVLITDGPTVVAPGTVDGVELSRVTAFELRVKEQTLGLMSMSPIPAANFTSEGAFRAPPDFSWSAAAEDELTERLNRLLSEGGSEH